MMVLPYVLARFAGPVDEFSFGALGKVSLV